MCSWARRINTVKMAILIYGFNVITIKISAWPRVVFHACNPITLGGQGGWITRGQVLEGQHHESPSQLKKIQKLARHGGVCL